jgi:hypothetical protein
MRIEDGAGAGSAAKVNSRNQLQTFAATASRDLWINEADGKYFSLDIDAIDPVGADDYFFYLKNTGNQNNINLTDIRIMSTVAGFLEVHIVTGTKGDTSAATVTPVPRNLNSNRTLSATIETDTDATGLTSQGVLLRMYLPANTWTQFKTTANFIATPGTAMAFRWDQGTGVLSGTVSVMEVNSPEWTA